MTGLLDEPPLGREFEDADGIADLAARYSEDSRLFRSIRGRTVARPYLYFRLIGESVKAEFGYVGLFLFALRRNRSGGVHTGQTVQFDSDEANIVGKTRASREFLDLFHDLVKQLFGREL